MDVLFIFTSSLFFLWVIRDLFFWLSVWQQNDYRQNRFFAAIRKRPRKQPLPTTIFFFIKWFIFFAYGLVILNDSSLDIYQYVIFGLYLVQSFFLLQEIYLNHLRKPIITFRVTGIIAVTLATVLLLFAIPLVDRFFWLLFIDLLTPVIVAFYVLVSSFPIEIYNDSQIEKAGQKIREHPDVLVIAVTGSVGKSLTKDYIAAILSRKFHVIKTEGKDNNTIGVAQTILKKLDDKTQIFVAEISAYQKGEIGMLCELIKPQIGVLTNINSYYLPIFKTMDAITKTNFELVQSLPKQGFCLYDGNSKNTWTLYKKSRKTKVLYRSSPNNVMNTPVDNEIVASNIVHKQKRTTFSVKVKNEKFDLNLKRFHHIEALLPALYIASYLGMTEQEIKRQVALLK